jgi:DNA polymerase-3 subunit gamma/tau
MAENPSSHLVLARKWRPERFSELVGQEHVTRTLVQALKSGRIAHAFLFTGIRGVGKTTAARILARCLNCAEGPTPEPCGKCPACLEIRAGSALDVVEIDGATYRKIDDARAIIENLSYRPARDRFKVYIIDEAHQLTDQAFNALLKTLEEPPPHVKFILATTEPQKMPETILSRLQRYDFRRIPFAAIVERLTELASRETVEAEPAALRMLAREAGGSMRDAERMLETAIASLDGKVVEAEVASILGVASRSRVFQTVEAILAHDAAAALGAVRELHRRGANLESLGRDLLEVLRNLAVAKLPGGNGGESPLADLPDQEADELKRLAAAPSGRDLMRLFRLMADAQERIIRSPYPELILEMAIVRMASLAPVLDADELMRAIRGGSAGGSSSQSTPRPASLASGGTAPGPAGPRGAAAHAEAVFTPAPARKIRVEGEVKADAPRRREPPAPPRQNPPMAAAPAASTTSDLPDLREFIRGRRAALAGFMEQGATLHLDGDLLTVAPRNDIYVRYLTDKRNEIADLATELYGRKIRAEIAAPGAQSPPANENSASPIVAEAAPPPAGSDDSPSVVANGGSLEAAATAAPAPPTAAELRQSVYSDPVVRRIFDEFQARLVEVRANGSAAAPSEGAARKP